MLPRCSRSEQPSCQVLRASPHEMLRLPPELARSPVELARSPRELARSPRELARSSSELERSPSVVELSSRELARSSSELERSPSVVELSSRGLDRLPSTLKRLDHRQEQKGRRQSPSALGFNPCSTLLQLPTLPVLRLDEILRHLRSEGARGRIEVYPTELEGEIA